MVKKVLQIGYEPEPDLGRLGHSLRPGPGRAASGSARRGHMASSLL